MYSSSRNNLGRVVIDYLTLTYHPDEDFVRSLTAYNDEFERGQFHFAPTKAHGFEYAFNISMPSDTLPICVIKFNSPLNQWDNYIHISISNHVFYDAPTLERAVYVGRSLDLKYLGTARIDLAVDKSNNLLTLIRRQIKQYDTVPIVNNRCVWDRDEVIRNSFAIGKLTRNRVKVKSLYVHNSNKSLVLKCYDKLAEISDGRASTGDEGYKQYILDYYGNPRKSLHRLEVSATNKFLYDFPVKITPELILDQGFLQVLYYQLVSRLLSFSTVSVVKGEYRSRKPIAWSSLLGLPGNDNNITSYTNNNTIEWRMDESWCEGIGVSTGSSKVLTENLGEAVLMREVEVGGDVVPNGLIEEGLKLQDGSGEFPSGNLGEEPVGNPLGKTSPSGQSDGNFKDPS